MTKIDENREQNSNRYQLNSPQVVDEEVDGEIIVINLGNGNYYSLLEEGAEIWQLLSSGKSLGETMQLIESRYEAEKAVIDTGITQFVAELKKEGLIVLASDVQPTNASPLPEVDQDAVSQELPTSTSVRPVFTAPKLNMYIDMQDLMLLDPIHEVDETGWPSATPPTP